MGQDIRKMFMDVIRKWTPHLDEPAEEDCWAPEIEKAGPDKLKEIQSEKLEIAFRYIYEYSPYYSNKYKKAGLTPSDIKSIEDLHKIPVTDKEDLRAAIKGKPPWGDFSCIDDDYWKNDGWTIWWTTGSTGAPVPCRYSQFDRVTQAWQAARHMWMSGFRRGDLAMFCAPFITHMFAWAHYSGLVLAKIPAIPAGPPMPTEARIGHILGYRPTLLLGTPTYMIYLGETMKERGIDPKDISVREILIGGEPGGSLYATRKRLMTLWGCDVCDGFGTTEVGALGGHAHTCEFETKDQGRNSNLHFTEDSGIPEILNPETFEPVPDGENGTIVWSSVSTVSQPILRFNLNDIMNIQSVDCPCGRGLRMAVGGVQGRADDMIHVSGVNVFPANIEEAVRSIDEFGNEYRLKLMDGKKGMINLIVEAEIRPEVPEQDHERLIKELQAKIFDKCQINPKIESVPYGELPRAEFKSKRILDLREKDEG